MVDDVFNIVASDARKERGMAVAAENRRALLEIARGLAVSAARAKPDGCITIDDVMKLLISSGYSPTNLGNSAGSVFKGGCWMFTGRFVNSERVSNHSRVVRVWRLKNG